jgi:hypothetical protein
VSCRADAVAKLLDLGAQPPSNRYEEPAAGARDTHPLVFGQCTRCGLLQLIDPMPAAMAKSRFEWLTYNEPEAHLDGLVERLRRLPGIRADSPISALTYKDDSTLARFSRLGHARTYRYDPMADFGLADPLAGLESIQAALDEPLAAALAVKHGSVDLLLVRHVLEHAHDPLRFLRAAAKLVKPGGYPMFELPDCVKFVRACDYSFVWEEHITYLCAQTVSTLVANAGLTMHETIVHPYPLEDSLLAIVRNAPCDAVRDLAPGDKETLLRDGENFGRHYLDVRARLQSLFQAWRRDGKRVALFGAGHLAARFINFFALGEWIDSVIDDNPHKQRVLMPGSRLGIHGSAALESCAIDVCLLALSPESEEKVLARQRAFLDRGGRFLSIFAASPLSVYGLATS